MVYHQKNRNNVEKRIMDILQDHVRVVYQGAESLIRLLDCWKTPGREKFNKNLEQINELEAKANSMKKDAMKELSIAAPGLLFRIDLMRIIRSTDQILDLAQGVAFFLNKIDCDWIPPKAITDLFDKLSGKILQSVKSLKDLVRALYQKIEKVIEISYNIELIENQADEYYRTLIIEIAKLDVPKGLDVMIRESLDRMEDMVDSTRDVASYIRTYAMAR
ncbi:MAG: DUF47 family protein [Asgard group archaeon]|nr:DUF47 family protein [Asgard group archaeon]